MGSDLAAAHNSLAAIEEEEEYIKASFKERKKSVEQTIGKLSRDIGSGFTMQNIECKWIYDSPNVGEVSYSRIDTGEIVKTRPMSLQERQQELPLEPVAVNPQKPEETQEAVDAHFGVSDGYIPGFFSGFVPDTFPEQQIVDSKPLGPEVEPPALEAILGQAEPEPETPAEPEASRQRLLTMKGRKKKDAEPVAGKAPSGEDFDF